MPRSLADSRDWVETGTELCRRSISSLDEPAFDAPSALPGWTRKHLVAHLAANADAVGNLVQWAATGVETPMYASSDQRAADIEAGSRRPVTELAAWFATSAESLRSAMDALTSEQWAAEVVTAQGRTVPAIETPWMRAREVMVHAVDLDTGTTFTDLPADFLVALGEDIAAKRGLTWSDAGVEVEGDLVTGALPDVVAWLAGRSHGSLTTTSSDAVPTLLPWL